jgi:hypothetical protein
MAGLFLLTSPSVAAIVRGGPSENEISLLIGFKP